MKRNRVDRVVLLAVGASQQLALRRQVQGDIAFHLDGPDDEHSGGHQDRAALVLIAGVNCCLHGRGIERGTVAFGSEIADVIGLGAEVLVGSRLCLRAGSG